MKLLFHLTIVVVTANKFGGLRQKSFLKHHKNIKERTGRNAPSYQNTGDDSFLKHHNAETEVVEEVELSNQAPLSIRKSFGNIRRRTHLQHHKDTTKLHRRDKLSNQPSFDQLTWLLNKYKTMEKQFITEQHTGRYTLNHYFSKYVSKLQTRY